MKLPYVIDNLEITLAKVLQDLMKDRPDFSLDTATAYFNVGGFRLIREGLEQIRSNRLLLGTAPEGGKELGLIPKDRPIKGQIIGDLEALPFSEETLKLVEDLIAYLRREKVQVRVYDNGFLHAKCWLFYGDKSGQGQLFDRFQPLFAIVGSSNFTQAGLTSNNELNLTHKVMVDPEDAKDEDAARSVAWLADDKPNERITDTNRQLIKSEVGARAILELQRWFEAQWGASKNFKQELIDLLDASKFGQVEYTPYQIYMKSLYEYFRDDLDSQETSDLTRSAVDLAEFQEDAVKKARKILSRYHGVIIADSVGLGKTWIGKKLLEDYAYHMRQKALVICPASLKDMWKEELTTANIAATRISQELLGREDVDTREYEDADVILIDESHNFRNKSSHRYGNLEKIIGGNGGRGKQGSRKKIILLTATPINNDLLDLYHQVNLITQGDRSYFAACGIGDLYKYFLKARRREPVEISGDTKMRLPEGANIFNLLEEVVIRRTRQFIKDAYPDATIKGKAVRFPKRKLKTVRYDLEATYQGIYEEVVKGVESLKLAPYNLETYKKKGVEVDDLEVGRQMALVGIFKSLYLKRFESSVASFKISLKRALTFLKSFADYLDDGRLIRSGDFRQVLRYLERENDEDSTKPRSMASKIDDNEEACAQLEALGDLDPSQYSLQAVRKDILEDIVTLSELWDMTKGIGPNQDAKLQCLKELLSKDLRGKKVLIFTYYKDTAKYLYKNIGHPESEAVQKFRNSLGNPTIRRIDSDADPKGRLSIVRRFAPKAHDREELIGTEKEIDILVSTDVLSEGQNLQDCGHLLNYDLHWNPTRMVQRAGRIDRIGTEFDTLWIHNMFPDIGLEKLLKLVETLSNKIEYINDTGMLDASILGESVNPRSFNTLRRIEEEDGSVITEEEQFTELASNEFLSQNLRNLLNSGGQEMLDDLPDGIHSGLIKQGYRGIFFYFQGRPDKKEKYHFWKYYDLKSGEIIDNRFIVANLIACERDETRVVDPDMEVDVFEAQEKVIEAILSSFQQQQALETAPRSLDPIQQTLATTIQGYMNHPDIDRNEALQAIRFMNQPRMAVQIKKFRQLYKMFKTDGDAASLLQAILDMVTETDVHVGEEEAKKPKLVHLMREDLRLICFDYIS